VPAGGLSGRRPTHHSVRSYFLRLRVSIASRSEALEIRRVSRRRSENRLRARLPAPRKGQSREDGFQPAVSDPIRISRPSLCNARNTRSWRNARVFDSRNIAKRSEARRSLNPWLNSPPGWPIACHEMAKTERRAPLAPCSPANELPQSTHRSEMQTAGRAVGPHWRTRWPSGLITSRPCRRAAQPETVWHLCRRLIPQSHMKGSSYSHV
jgi:hypothetical protein